MRSLLSFSCVVVGLLCSGCAATRDMRAVNHRVDKLERQLDEAIAEARAAREGVQEANARARRTEEMLNRSFKRSMYK